MASLTITKHAKTRFSQRSISEHDLKLVMIMASEVDDGFMILNRDYKALESEVKRILQRAKRLVGKRFVIEGETVITAYHCNKGKTKTLLQHSRSRSMK